MDVPWSAEKANEETLKRIDDLSRSGRPFVNPLTGLAEGPPVIVEEADVDYSEDEDL